MIFKSLTNLANFASLSSLSFKSFKSVEKLCWFTILLYWMSESSLIAANFLWNLTSQFCKFSMFPLWKKWFLERVHQGIYQLWSCHRNTIVVQVLFSKISPRMSNIWFPRLLLFTSMGWIQSYEDLKSIIRNLLTIFEVATSTGIWSVFAYILVLLVLCILFREFFHQLLWSQSWENRKHESKARIIKLSFHIKNIMNLHWC